MPGSTRRGKSFQNNNLENKDRVKTAQYWPDAIMTSTVTKKGKKKQPMKLKLAKRYQN